MVVFTGDDEAAHHQRRYGAAAAAYETDIEWRRRGQSTAKQLLVCSIGAVLALVAAHCMAGFAVYGSGRSRMVQLLQVGSLTLSTKSPALVQQAIEQSWSEAVEPSDKSLQDEGEAMLAEMRATKHLAHEVAAVKEVEAKFSKPQPHESLEQLLRPPPPGQQPTMLLQVGTGDGISALGVGVKGFKHFEAAGVGKGDDYYQAKYRYGGNAIQQQLSAMHKDAEQAAAQQAETAEEERTIHRIRTPSSAGARGRSNKRTKRQSLLEPNVYPKVGYPFEQQVSRYHTLTLVFAPLPCLSLTQCCSVLSCAALPLFALH